ncbi:MAG TPA: beta-ketoacyl synthase N-terminal-like domain-containing protein, partial [Gemmatimonadales bacterium]|nr:beta-ketoacyl synthase N-terminal-like domain-containing protein [Gemmatimonadales bacterium]
MADRRVVITGIGPVTPIGIGIQSFWTGLQGARSVVRRVTRFDPSPFRSQLAAEVDGFDPTAWMDPRRAKRLDRCSQFTLAAARLAVADAGLELAAEDPDRIGAMMGSALGGVEFAEREHEKYLAGGVRAVEPGLALTVFVGAASCNLAIELGISGPNITNGM